MESIEHIDNFEVTISSSAERARLHLRGELDMATAPILAEHVEQVTNGNGKALLLVDLSELTYCDSTGIRVLLQAAALCERDGARFRVVGANGSVRRVLEMTDTIEALHVDGDGV